MTTELTCLVANALFGLLLVFLEISAKTRVAGTAWNVGNRETAPAFPAWIERISRAGGNHKENFPVFLTAVVVVHLAHREDRVSAMAAVAYVAARFFHAILYIGGIRHLRSLAFTVGLLAMLAIFSRVLP